MSKEYAFKYIGSKESFLNMLNSFHTNNSRFYYLDDYIIEVLDDEIRFGIERFGHAGGKWFISKFSEEHNEIEFRGTIQYIGPDNSNERTKKHKIVDRIWAILLYVLLFPVFVIFFIISKIEWLIKNTKKPTPKTTEDKLVDLMEKHLNCQKVINEINS